MLIFDFPAKRNFTRYDVMQFFTNRVSEIVCNSDAAKRDAGYWKLYHQLRPSGGGLHLDQAETSTAFEFISSFQLFVRERQWLWKLLLHGTQSKIIENYALARLSDTNEDSYIRGLAFLYLRRFAVDLLPSLVEQFSSDPSPDIRYQIASDVKDPERRRALLRAILPDCGDNHELYDGIQLELYYMDKGTDH